ncbi:hypothetical protein [Bacillus sp. T33-2]|uniref:hypothetical protein n=1 Tax=Bacillus sp. T33-2 TaxID=2054168 RepID=UPI000C77D5C2|nr:hypothetical protein [Bacillus sp. T33-2]PLR99600.1 hypothetical protein CVD19_00625 [Bacillus sp. T33-2]
MNIVQMYELCKKIYNENIDTYEYIGLRFEDKQRSIGEICENSRNNTDREDEREFPEYGTDEYFELEELDGTSAWDMSEENIYKIGRYENREDHCSRHFEAYHCYVIAGNRLGHTSNTVIDVNEIVIKDAVVIAKIF